MRFKQNTPKHAASVHARQQLDNVSKKRVRLCRFVQCVLGQTDDPINHHIFACLTGKQLDQRVSENVPENVS
jgi:hypothetical protein